MTALCALLTPAAVVVMTDTLITNHDYRPTHFGAKAYPVPHLDALISGRGCSQLIAGLAFDAACRSLIADFDVLIELAAKELPVRWASLEAGPLETSTAYIWGWSPRHGKFMGYAFSSASGFAAEEMPEGRLCAPGLSDEALAADLLANPDQLAGLLDIMIAAAEEGRADPAPEPCQIGGEVILYLLKRDDDGSVSTTSRIIHRFPNREADYFEALRTNGFRP